MPQISFYTPWKQKTRGFLMFPGGAESEQWYEMGYLWCLFNLGSVYSQYHWTIEHQKILMYLIYQAQMLRQLDCGLVILKTITR